MDKYVLTYAGCDWIAGIISGSGKIPNCLYTVYTNNTPSPLTLTSDMTASSFAGLTGSSWYLRSVGRMSCSVKSNSSEYEGNRALFSSIVRSTDVVAGEDKPVVSSGSKLYAVALVYAEDAADPSKDIVIAVANLTYGGAFSPVSMVTNTNMAISCPLTFTTVLDGGE